MEENKTLKSLVDEKGLKLKFLAKKLGIRYETLYFKLKGTKEFTQSEVKKLVEILEIPADKVFNFF